MARLGGRFASAAGDCSDAVVGRLDRLSENAREIVNLLAVIGTSVTFERLKAVSSVEEEELVAALDELTGQRIVEERPDTGAGWVTTLRIRFFSR